MTDQPTNKPLTVRDLLAILADCDPDALVSLYVPGFIAESDKSIVGEPGDALAGEFGYTPGVSAGFQTSAEVPYETFFDETGRTREGAKPNCVSITLRDDDTDRLIAARRLAIENAAVDAGMEPEPAVGDVETVIVDVAMPRTLH